MLIHVGRVAFIAMHSVAMNLVAQAGTVLAQVENLNAEVTEMAPAQQPAAPDGGGFLQQFLGNPINLILFSLILFFLLVAQPQRKQAKRQRELLAGIKKNDRIITGSGVHGVVVSANSGEPTVSIRIDDNTGTRMTINRESIATVLTAGGGDATK